MLDAPTLAPSAALLSPGPRKGRRLCRWHLKRARQVVRAPEVENVLVQPLRTVTPMTRGIAIASRARHMGDGDPALDGLWVQGRSDEPTGRLQGQRALGLAGVSCVLLLSIICSVGCSPHSHTIDRQLTDTHAHRTGRGRVAKHRPAPLAWVCRAALGGPRPCSRSVCPQPRAAGLQGPGLPASPRPSAPWD